MNSLVDYIFGQRLDPNGPCAWCRKTLGWIEHYPIPVCGGCFQLAYDNHRPPNNQWERLMDEFPKQAKRWARRIQTTHSETELHMHATEASGDVLDLTMDAMRLSREGKRDEAAEVRKRAETKKREMDQFRSEIPAWGRDDD